MCDKDCFNCKYDDCINDSVYSEKSLYKNRSEEAKAADRARQKRRRDKAREAGLCIICQKKMAEYGSKCYECYIRQKRHDKKKCTGERERWRLDGLCYYCGQPVIKGRKVCEKHYEFLKENIKVCNESKKTKGAKERILKSLFKKKPEEGPK